MDDLFNIVVLFILGVCATWFTKIIHEPESDPWEALLAGSISILLLAVALFWPRNRPQPKNAGGNAQVNAPAYTAIGTPEDLLVNFLERLPQQVLYDLSDALLAQPAHTPLVIHQNNPSDDVANESSEDRNGPSKDPSDDLPKNSNGRWEGPYNSYYDSDDYGNSSEDSPIYRSNGPSSDPQDSYYDSDNYENSSEDSPIDRSRVEVMD